MREVGCDKFPTVSAASSSLLSLLLRLVLSLPILIDADLHRRCRSFRCVIAHKPHLQFHCRQSYVCTLATLRRSSEEISLIRVCRYQHWCMLSLHSRVTSCINNLPIQCLIHAPKQIIQARVIRTKISVFIRRIERRVENLLRSYNSRAGV